MAPSSSNQAKFEVPEGWKRMTKSKKKCYTNILDQRFYSESDLMRYINYAKESGLSIYAPDFKPPTTGPFAMRSKSNVMGATETASSSNPKSNKQKEADKGHDAQRLVDEVETEDEILCAEALLEISGQRSDERRSSRRISGRQPELQLDFELNSPWEYVIKDKRHKSQH